MNKNLVILILGICLTGSVLSQNFSIKVLPWLDNKERTQRKDRFSKMKMEMVTPNQAFEYFSGYQDDRDKDPMDIPLIYAVWDGVEGKVLVRLITKGRKLVTPVNSMDTLLETFKEAAKEIERETVDVKTWSEIREDLIRGLKKLEK